MNSDCERQCFSCDQSDKCRDLWGPEGCFIGPVAVPRPALCFEFLQGLDLLFGCWKKQKILRNSKKDQLAAGNGMFWVDNSRQNRAKLAHSCLDNLSMLAGWQVGRFIQGFQLRIDGLGSVEHRFSICNLWSQEERGNHMQTNTKSGKQTETYKLLLYARILKI